MGDIFTTIIMGFTIFCIVWGFLLGLIRGGNRSILRFIMILGCAVGAFFLKDLLIDVAMTLEIEGQTVEDMLVGALMESSELPEYLSQLIISLVEVVIGLVCFLVIFFALQFISWLILFPILKIFVRKGIKRRRLLGGVIGLLQGVLIAFVICSPLTGAIVQVDKISTLKISGETVGEMADLPDFSDYLDSPMASVYTSTGSWFFDAITTYTDTEGNKITLEETVQAAETGTKVVEEVEKITESLKDLNNPDSEKSNSDVLRDVASSLANMDEAITGTSDGGKQVLQQLIQSVGEMVGKEEGGSGGSEGGEQGGEQGGGEEGGASSDETTNKISEIIEKMDVNELKLDSAAEAIEGVADYLEKEEGEPVATETTEKIINGLADNMVVIEMIPEDTKLVEITDETDKENFTNAIENTELSREDKDKLLAILGLNGEFVSA